MRTLAERITYALKLATDAALAAGQPAPTQAALARACEVKSSSVSNWFTGETKSLKGDSLLLAAAYLGCDALWLGTGRGTARPSIGATPGPMLPPPDSQLLLDLEDLTPEEKAEWLRKIHAAADLARQHARHHASKVKQPAIAAKRGKARAAMAFVYPTLGDENPAQGHLPIDDGYDAIRQLGHDAVSATSLTREKADHPE